MVQYGTSGWLALSGQYDHHHLTIGLFLELQPSSSYSFKYNTVIRNS